MTDDELDRYARAIDAGKMASWHFTWWGVVFRALLLPLLLGLAIFGPFALLLLWWAP